MGLWSDWYEKHAGQENRLTSAEFVLKKIDEAVNDIELADGAESNTLPATVKTSIKTLLQTIRNNLKWLFNKVSCPFPVGYIYMSVSSANPGTIYPDTIWVAWGQGRTILGMGTSDSDPNGDATYSTVEAKGGSRTHKLTASEIPAHTHPISPNPHNHNVRAIPSGGVDNGPTFSSNRVARSYINSESTTLTIGENTNGEGSHNNLMPYITCYLFKRTN
jgi:hypothetical protein